MMNNKFLQVCLRLFSNGKIKCVPVMLLIFAALATQEAKAQDLVLRDITISTTESFSASNSIIAGPNFTITSSGDVTLNAPTVSLNPLVFVIEGGKFIVFSQTTVVNVKPEEPVIPDEFVVHQNYPNPFNPSTTIRYELPSRSHVVLKILNLLGQELATLVDEEKAVGKYEVSWDASRMASGLYFYRLQAGEFVETKTLMLLK